VLELQKLAPKHARVRRNNKDEVVGVETLRPGDVLVVQPGERIAADGKLVSGATSVDESSVTGESIPVDKTAGSDMLAGTIISPAPPKSPSNALATFCLARPSPSSAEPSASQPQIIRAADKFFAFIPHYLIASVIAWLVTKDPCAWSPCGLSAARARCCWPAAGNRRLPARASRSGIK